MLKTSISYSLDVNYFGIEMPIARSEPKLIKKLQINSGLNIIIKGQVVD